MPSQTNICHLPSGRVFCPKDEAARLMAVRKYAPARKVELLQHPQLADNYLDPKQQD
jgi:hypothetical protein